MAGFAGQPQEGLLAQYLLRTTQKACRQPSPALVFRAGCEISRQGSSTLARAARQLQQGLFCAAQDL